MERQCKQISQKETLESLGISVILHSQRNKPRRMHLRYFHSLRDTLSRLRKKLREGTFLIGGGGGEGVGWRAGLFFTFFLNHFVALPFSFPGKHVTLPYYYPFIACRAPVLHSRQLYDPSLTMTSFLIPIHYYQQYLLDFQSRTEMKRMFHGHKLNPGDD